MTATTFLPLLALITCGLVFGALSGSRLLAEWRHDRREWRMVRRVNRRHDAYVRRGTSPRSLP